MAFSTRAQLAFELKWEFKTSKAMTAPTISPSGLVVFAADKTIYAVDNRSGIQSWSALLPGAAVTPPSIGSDGTIYIGTVSPGDSSNPSYSLISALNPATGKIEWNTAVSRLNSELAIASDGGVIFGITTEGGFSAAVMVVKLNGQSGAMEAREYLWPFGIRDLAFLAVDSNEMLNVGYNVYPDSVEPAQSALPSMLVQFDTKTLLNRSGYRYDSHEFQGSASVDARGNICLSTSRTSTNDTGVEITVPALTLLRGSDGKADWSSSFHGYSPVIGSDGTIFGISSLDVPRLVAVNAGSGTIKWEATATNTLSASSISVPIIGVNGRLYLTRVENWPSGLGSYGVVQAFDEETGSLEAEMVRCEIDCKLVYEDVVCE